MFIPLYDINPLRVIRAPFVTYGLIIANVIVFALLQMELVAQQTVDVSFGVIPAEFRFGAESRSPLAMIPEPLTFITYMFFHDGWMHLITNMLFLWVFGDNVEDDMGHVRYLGFYALAGIGGALGYIAAEPLSKIPLVGASGAISGVVAAYVILHPKVKLWVLMLMRVPLKINAAWAIVGWIVFQIGGILLARDSNTAWWCHIGGLAAGAMLVALMRRPDVPLFGRELPTEAGGSSSTM